MREILILNPQINPDKQIIRRWSYRDEEVYKMLDMLCTFYHVTPNSHPRLCDLCSGDGSLADFFTQKGWDPKRITCIDKYRSPTPVVGGMVWEYINLHALSLAIRFHESMPERVKVLENMFDIVVEFHGGLRSEEMSPVGRFFIRNGGFAFCTGLSGIVSK